MSNDDHIPEKQCITESLEFVSYSGMQAYMTVLSIVKLLLNFILSCERKNFAHFTDKVILHIG